MTEELNPTEELSVDELLDEQLTEEQELEDSLITNITNESNISRFMQQLVPKTPTPAETTTSTNTETNTQTDGSTTLETATSESQSDLNLSLNSESDESNFEKHKFITKYDTLDLSIIEDLSQEVIDTSVLKTEKIDDIPFFDELDNTVVTKPETTGILLREINPTSNLTEYNKITVLIDRDGHSLFFDYTPNNRRIHLKHPSGTYFTIDNNGTFNLKINYNYLQITKGYSKRIVGKDSCEYVQGFKRINVDEGLITNVQGASDLHVNGDKTTTIELNEEKFIAGSKTTTLENNYTIYVKGYEFHEVQGNFILSASETAKIQSPHIILETGNLDIRTKGSYKEFVNGGKEIAGDAITLSAIDNLTLSTARNMTISAGSSQEVIAGVSNPPAPFAKETKILLGDMMTNLLLGNYTVNTVVGMITILAAAPLPVTVGNSLGQVLFDILGGFNMKGLMGSVESLIGMTSLKGMIKVNLGEGAEPVLKGTTTQNWLATHTHPSGVGPTGPPTEAANLLQCLSFKVFTD